jgi:hypothetical protein
MFDSSTERKKKRGQKVKWEPLFLYVRSPPLKSEVEMSGNLNGNARESCD